MYGRIRNTWQSDLGDVAFGHGILAGTHIRTLDGALPVEFLCPGDRIVTRSGTVRLSSILAWLRRDMGLIRIRASSLGHDRPDTDLLVAPGQRVLIRDWRARALYGSEVAAIPAERLIDGEFVLTEHRAEVRLFALGFKTDEVIYAEGLELSCRAVKATADAS